MAGFNEIEHLTAEAHYRRQRYDAYQERMLGPRPTSKMRLQELQRWCESAEARLDDAKARRLKLVKRAD
jgi:hypothetical protein